MSRFLCLTVRFLQPSSHGRGDGGEPEWPPSPLRVFQALVNAAAGRWNERTRLEYAAPALEWLAKQPAPAVVAAVGVKSEVKYRTFVPDNTGDLAAGAWARGDTTRIVRRTEKDVRPTHLTGDAVHYLYSVADADVDFATHRETLCTAARSITHLGWGVDMVAGNASVVSEEEAAKLDGERWRPTPDGSGTPLRVPVGGTLDALVRKHDAFLNRLSDDGFRPVPPLTAFRVVGYRRDTEQAERPFAAFELHKTVAELADLPAGKSRFRAFDSVRRFAHVAGMVRHAAARVARSAGWDDARVDSFVCGHGSGKDGQASTDDRLMFLPLPSVTPLKVESIRRVLVVGPPGREADVAQLRRSLHGCELIREESGEPIAMLSVISQSDRNVLPYTEPSRVWSTVTPLALPGFDDPNGIRRRLRGTDPARAMTATEKRNQLAALDRRTRGLLETAFGHAGFQPGLLHDSVIEWRSTGFRAGVDLAGRYTLDPLKYPRYHVRIRFPAEVTGPLAVGAGRYRGLGLFAREG